MKNQVFNVEVQKDGSIVLPKEMLDQMFIKVGETLQITYTSKDIANRCFTVSEENEEAEFDDEWYCIPVRYLEAIGLQPENVHVVLQPNELLLTNTENILSVIPNEFRLAMLDQDVDLQEIASYVVERMQKDVCG